MFVVAAKLDKTVFVAIQFLSKPVVLFFIEGFAVVAEEEVRKLVETSQAASKGINELTVNSVDFLYKSPRLLKILYRT